MNSHTLARKAVRATQEADAARREVERLEYLLAEHEAQMRLCIQDGEQPKWATNRICTLDQTGRCACGRCNHLRTWTDWFNTVGYYHILFRIFPLEEQLAAAQQTLKLVKAEAKLLANQARKQSLVEMGFEN